LIHIHQPLLRILTLNYFYFNMESKAQELARLVLEAEKSTNREESKKYIRESKKLKYLPS
jgi:hypothetical protein